MKTAAVLVLSLALGAVAAEGLYQTARADGAAQVDSSPSIRPVAAADVGGGLDQQLQDLVVRLTVIAAGAVGSWIAAHAAKWVPKWLKGNAAAKEAASLAERYKLEQLIADAAIHYAEEQAHKAGAKLSGTDKLKKAIDFAESHGLDRLAADGIQRVAQIIESRLGATRTGVVH